MEISIKTNFPQVQRALAQLQADVGGKAMASALNKTIAIAKTQMQREITAEFNVTAGYVRERLRIARAVGRRGLQVLRAELAAKDRKGRGANIIAFVTSLQRQARAGGGKQKPLFVKIKKKGGRTQVKGRFGKGAFIGNKGRTVFERTGDKRLPIRAVTTIDVAQMFNTRRINSRVVRAMTERFPAIFANEAAFFVRRFNATGRP